MAKVDLANENDGINDIESDGANSDDNDGVYKWQEGPVTAARWRKGSE